MRSELDSWIDSQWRASVKGLLLSVSPHLTKTRSGLGQSITARRGAIVASPVLAAYDPEPDYFFHWYRDSSLVLGALQLLRADESLRDMVEAAFADFVDFSVQLMSLDGAVLADSAAWREAVQPDFVQYLRSVDELSGIRGLAVSADTRVNPDGSLDITRWARPQHDGPALRALALLEWLGTDPPDPALGRRAVTLLRSDLDFVHSRALIPCFDPWEEELGWHYYTLRVSAAALEGGADWLDRQGGASAAAACRRCAADILRKLDEFAHPTDGYYRSRELPDGKSSDKALDIAVLLACIHAKSADRQHGVLDPKLLVTFERLVALFAAEYPLNRAHPDAPAMGRYANDRYYSGGPYFFSTLGAAEYCYRRAAAAGEPAWFLRGDLFLGTVRRYTPGDGTMSEQFDRHTGAACSARQLAWSYAAFLSCIDARRGALHIA